MVVAEIADTVQDNKEQRGGARTPIRSEVVTGGKLVREREQQQRQQRQQRRQLAYERRGSVEGVDDVGVLEAGQQETENGAIVEPGTAAAESLAITASVDHENGASSTYDLHPLDYLHQTSVQR